MHFRRKLQTENRAVKIKKSLIFYKNHQFFTNFDKIWGNDKAFYNTQCVKFLGHFDHL